MGYRKGSFYVNKDGFHHRKGGYYFNSGSRHGRRRYRTTSPIDVICGLGYMMILAVIIWLCWIVKVLIVATFNFFVTYPSVFAVVALLIIYFVYIELKD